MARNGNARKPGDRVKVKRMMEAGTRTYAQIAERTGIPLGTVCRYASELKRAGDVHVRQSDNVRVEIEE